MPRRAGSPGVQGGPDPTKCVSPQCFDALVRSCVACKLFRTPERRSVEPSSLAPSTPLQHQESVGTGVTTQAEPVLPLPALLLGAPVLLGLALALVLVLVALVTLRRRRRRSRGPASPEAQESEQDVGLHPLTSQREGCAAGEASRTGMEKAVTQF
ncbi:tumor necrosis factor receptor superfamily member 13C isoform 2-T2 [Glossophaga mutica]